MSDFIHAPSLTGTTNSHLASDFCTLIIGSFIFFLLDLNVDHIFFLNIDIENTQYNIIHVNVFLGKAFSHDSEEVIKRQRTLQSVTVKLCFNAASDLKAFCLTCTKSFHVIRG